MKVQTVMSLASPALLFVCFYTHSLRCGLEECRQLRWLCPKSRAEHQERETDEESTAVVLWQSILTRRIHWRRRRRKKAQGTWWELPDTAS